MVLDLANIQKAIENGPVEIVHLPSYKMVDLSIVFSKRLPGRVSFGDRRPTPWCGTLMYRELPA